MVYSNELKTQFGEIARKALIGMLSRAVSRLEVAQALAEGIRKRCLSSYGVRCHRRGGGAFQVLAREQKPVGLVYIALTQVRKARRSSSVIFLATANGFANFSSMQAALERFDGQLL